MQIQTRIKQKSDTEANWKSNSTFKPLEGEICYYSDLNKIKIGVKNAATSIADLPFLDCRNADSALSLQGTSPIELVKGTLSLSNLTLTYTSSKGSTSTITFPTASSSAAGWMSSTDKSKLDGLSNYVLNTATSSSLGGIKVGYSSSGRTYAVTIDSNGNAYVSVPSDNTWRGIQNNLTSTSTTDSLSAYQGKLLNDTKENLSNKVTTVSSSSTDAQYPSAKALYDMLPKIWK